MVQRRWCEYKWWTTPSPTTFLMKPSSDLKSSSESGARQLVSILSQRPVRRQAFSRFLNSAILYDATPAGLVAGAVAGIGVPDGWVAGLADTHP